MRSNTVCASVKQSSKVTFEFQILNTIAVDLIFVNLFFKTKAHSLIGKVGLVITYPLKCHSLNSYSFLRIDSNTYQCVHQVS